MPTPASSRRATVTAPALHCLLLLTRLAAHGTAFAQRLRDYRKRCKAVRAHYRANALYARVHLALSYLAILVAKLSANPAYRGEPPRPTRPVRTAPPAPPRAACPARRRKPRPYEQIFAGRSIGQVVERIRRDLGLSPRRIAPYLDELLSRPPGPRDPPSHPRRRARPLQPRARRASLRPRLRQAAHTPAPPATVRPAARSPPAAASLNRRPTSNCSRLRGARRLARSGRDVRRSTGWSMSGAAIGVDRAPVARSETNGRLLRS